MSTLQSIAWSDLCVSADPASCWYKETPDSMVVAAIPENALAETAELWRALEDAWEQKGALISKYGFAITWPADNGMRMRVKRIELANEQHVYVCRAFRMKARTFEEIGMTPALASRLLASDMRSGIGIFLGKPGSGKTTTVAAYLRERAARLGGVTWTIESPVEIHLEGRYGSGYIHQRELETPEMIGEAVRDLARATPNVLWVGEVIDDATAEAATNASKMGFLVLCTFHGGDLINGIERFARSAGRGAISMQFVEAFRFAVHVDLRIKETAGHARPIDDAFIKSMPTGTPPRILGTRSLFCMRDEDPMRGHMKNGEFQKLNSEIDRQKGELLRELSNSKIAATGR